MQRLRRDQGETSTPGSFLDLPASRSNAELHQNMPGIFGVDDLGASLQIPHNVVRGGAQQSQRFSQMAGNPSAPRHSNQIVVGHPSRDVRGIRLPARVV